LPRQSGHFFEWEMDVPAVIRAPGIQPFDLPGYEDTVMWSNEEGEEPARLPQIIDYQYFD
jgi:hypothetical protein